MAAKIASSFAIKNTVNSTSMSRSLILHSVQEVGAAVGRACEDGNGDHCDDRRWGRYDPLSSSCFLTVEIICQLNETYRRELILYDYPLVIIHRIQYQ